MIIKVCGMCNPENIQDAKEVGVNWIGFIFYEKSPRCFLNTITVNNFRNISIPFLSKVGVFVNPTQEQLFEAAKEYQLDYLQLHGDESPDFCNSIHKRGFALIKAISIASEKDLERIHEYEGTVDYFLFDTKSKQYGGSGKLFDWSILTAYTGNTPFLLSGGINPESVNAIQKFKHPQFAGIDLNSGFEIKPGLKDIHQLKTFLDNLKTT